jgi:hypothetical protein
MAAFGSQFPSAATEPAILMVWPNVVVTISLNVTATVAAGVHAAEVVDEAVRVEVERVDVLVPVAVTVAVTLPEIGVWFGGQEPVDAVLYVPKAEVAEHTDGTLDVVGSPQEYGTTPALRAAAERNAA